MIAELVINEMRHNAGMLATAAPLVPHTRRPSVSNSIWYMNSLLTILATGEETAGRFALIEATIRQGDGPPRHVHRREDELFYILDGEVTIYVGDETIKAAAGACAFLPRGIPHTFRVNSEQARALILITPAGFENWFTEFGEPAQAMTVPPPAAEPSYSDVELMIEVGKRYGLEFLPPAR
jgi:quercetin dioxygenase-like cupin family protein